MNFPDLTYLFENQAIIELKTSHYDYFNVGDFVIVNDANVLLMSKASSPEEAMECEFLNKTYSNIFEKASHGKYFCQVVEKNRNILSILMVYDLNIKYESEYNKSGIVISALEGALSGTSISELNNNISKNYRIEISGKYYYVMGKHVKTRGNAFILASPSTQRFYSVTSKLLEELVEKEEIAGDEYASFAEEKRNNSNLAEQPDNQTAYRLVEDIDEVISIIDGQIRNLNRRLRNKPIELAKYYAKRLPTSKEEWSDNGFAFCEHAIDCFESLDFISEIKECVQLLSNEIINETVSFKNISAIKMKLILALDQTEFMTEENKESINNTILSLIDCMKQFRQNDREEIISDFATYLYPNSETLLAIKKYQQIIAATHQYSSREGIEHYHDILVDEAARSCPADLMIPLACSENRVILVGDHEQLPQFVEDNVLNELYKTCDIEEFSDEDDDEESADFEKKIRRSMFQYLMDKCEQLTKQDPLHKRVIALDTQYRMPPVLGDLVARNFYKDIGLHNSKKPQSSFDQSYPNIEHKNMVWINASKMGTTEDHNGSYRRKYEAEIIAKYVKEIVESTEWKVLPEEKKKEEIGVITFYSWQKEEIKEKLIKLIYFKYFGGLTKNSIMQIAASELQSSITVQA